MKRTPEEYISIGFYGDGDLEGIESYQEKVVKCRKPHECSGCARTIQKGDFALRETGFMDGTPVSNYVCIPCLDEWLDEINPLEEEEDERE